MEIIIERIVTAEGVEGYLARPATGKVPAVLVDFEIFGVNDHIQDICRRLAAEGYAALAPDYYFRLPTRTVAYSDVKTGFGLALTLKDDQVMGDVGSCLRYLKAQDFVEASSIGTLGFCMGGRLSFLTATQFSRDISAAVSFYGGGLAGENRRDGQTINTLEEAAKLRCPLLLFYGELDQHITGEHVDRFTGRLKELGKGFQSYVYRGAGHGFFCNERGSYNPTAASDAWRKTVDFLAANLKSAVAN